MMAEPRLIFEGMDPMPAIWEVDRIQTERGERRLLMLDSEVDPYYVLTVGEGPRNVPLRLCPYYFTWYLTLQREKGKDCSEIALVPRGSKLWRLRRSLDPWVPTPERTWNKLRKEAGLPPIVLPTDRTVSLSLAFSRGYFNTSFTWKPTWHRGVRV